MELSFTPEQILKLVGASAIEGNQKPQTIRDIASLDKAQPGDLSFLGNRKYRSQMPDSKASIILIPEDYEGRPLEDQAFIRVENPSHALGLICEEIVRVLWPKPDPGIHPSAYIADSANVCSTAYIGPHVIIEDGAKIGRHAVIEGQAYVGRHAVVGEASHLMPRATVLDYCELGSRVRLHSGVVIGSEGFGYETIQGVHHKLPQIGKVVIEDDVEIGSNTAIDRARFSETRIGAGTKIDNLVQIAHNVTTGKHCILVAQAGIAGSTTLDDYVVLGGQVGVAGHIHIGKGSMVGAQSGLNGDIEAGSFVRGTPVLPFQLAHRIDILKQRLPDLFKRVEHLEEVVGKKPNE